jgi:vesicle coat complex subunit
MAVRTGRRCTKGFSLSCAIKTILGFTIFDTKCHRYLKLFSELSINIATPRIYQSNLINYIYCFVYYSCQKTMTFHHGQHSK